MWILPKQLHTSAYVADTKALELDLEKLCQMSENALMWRSKLLTSPTWLRRWKKAKYIQHLFTRILKPSHTKSFVDAWTSYLAASHANLSVMRVLKNVPKIQDTYFHTLPKESSNADQQLSFLKTWQESSQPKPQTENQFCNMSCEHWKAWVTEQRQEYSQRVKLAHLTRESEFSSWATPNVCGNHNRKGASKTSGDGLSTQVKNWATPNTMDVLPARCPEKLAKAKKKGGCKNLREEVMNWPTASVAGCVEGGVAKNVQMTPSGFKATRENGTSYGAKLRDAVIHHEQNNGLPDQVNHNRNGKNPELFPTPRANEVHPKITEENREQLASRNKGNLEEDIAGHCGKATGKLNPNWVEQLMGIPVGWTQLPTDWID